MNRFTVPMCVLLVVVVNGCGLLNSRYVNRNFEIGELRETPVGSTMIRAESGFRNDVYKTVIVGQQCDLVYGGTAKGIIRITYREFDLDEGRPMPTPIYTQDLQYDLNESRFISFRKTLIEIMHASNDKIVYKVLDDPDPTEEY
ncbi:MAG: hypothetical protein ACKVRP_13240 [Bacteroidota bacterium]